MPNNEDAVIIVPTQGHDCQSFQAVARALNSKVYGGKATIVYAQVSDNGGKPLAKLYKDKNLSKAFSFDDVKGLKTVMAISHGFSGDGPNLAYGDESLAEPLHQPWRRDTTNTKQLSADATSFWSSVGKALKANGKTILLGCFMGAGDYDDLVAAASGHTVYAAKDSFGAGDVKTAVSAVQKIEKNKAPKVMNRVDVPTSSTD